MASDLARPKSVILGVPSAASRTLPGFRSRWTMPSRCASATARASASINSAARRAGQGVPSSRRSRLPPSTILQLEEGQAVGLADVVDLHDVGVLQAGDGLRLGQEADGGLVVGMGTGQDHLQGAGAVQEDLSGAVDDAHAAAAQLAQDLVAGDGRNGPLSGSRRCVVVVRPRHGRCSSKGCRNAGESRSRSATVPTGSCLSPGEDVEPATAEFMWRMNPLGSAGSSTASGELGAGREGRFRISLSPASSARSDPGESGPTALDVASTFSHRVCWSRAVEGVRCTHRSSSRLGVQRDPDRALVSTATEPTPARG